VLRWEDDIKVDLEEHFVRVSAELIVFKSVVRRKEISN
jgi:hypothetical protein